MATKDEKHERLHEFLELSFHPDELNSFLKLQGFAEVNHAVNRDVGGAQYIRLVIEALDHRSLIDTRFFNRLTVVRPHKAGQIKSLEQFWLEIHQKNSQPFSENLAQQLKSATSLGDLIWSIGKSVVQEGYEQDHADLAYSHYLQSYERRHAQVKILGMLEPVPLASIYTEVRLVPPTFLHSNRTQEELQDLFLRKGHSLASKDSNRGHSRPALEVANDENYQFLNLLGSPGAGKSTFLRYIGWMALQRDRLGTTSQGERDPAKFPYRFNLLPVLLELRSAQVLIGLRDLDRRGT